MMMNDSLIKCAVAVLLQHKWRVTSVYYWAPLIRVEYFSHDSLIKRRSIEKTLTYRLPTNERPHCCLCQTFFCSANGDAGMNWTVSNKEKREIRETERMPWLKSSFASWVEGCGGSWRHATGEKSKNSCLLRLIVMQEESTLEWRLLFS